MENTKVDNLVTGSAMLATASPAEVRLDHQAYQILHWGFVILPILAGIDKFVGFLTDWSMYLAPQIASVLGAATTMHIVGIIEIVAAIGVALKPRWFAPIVALWLWGIVINLLLLGGFYDIALRDFGLSLGALGLWRLSQHFDTTGPRHTG